MFMLKHFSIKSVNSWIWGPLDSGLGNTHTALKAFLRIFVIFIKEFQRDNIPLRSCALTFTIVLSLVPTLALGTAVLKGLGAGDQMREAAYHFIDSLESSASIDPKISAEDIAVATNETEVATEGQTPQVDDSALTGHLRKAADQIFDYVDRTDFATLGAFGVVGLVFAVLSVLGSIEQAMNVIWKAGSGRPFGRKLMDYLALMILLPLSVNLALATEATLQNKTLFNMFNDLLPTAWLSGFLLKILPLLLVIGTFTVLYRFLPNVKVRILPALAGGIFGGTSWLFTQTLYFKMQIGVAKYNAIYGSFATLPLFLLWLYIGWIIFLAGAEAAFACQVWRRYSRHDHKMSPHKQLSMAFFILEHVFNSFQDGKMESPSEISRHLNCREDEVRSIVDLLTKGGLLRHVSERKFDGYVPAKPEEKLDNLDTLKIILGPRPASEHQLATNVYKAAAASIAGKPVRTTDNI